MNVHPLSINEIREVALACWDLLWQTRVGAGSTAILLSEIDVPSTVVGYFYERLIARELQSRYPREWRGGITKEEKDLVYLPNNLYSVEVKSSGQLGLKIFGNRSYGKKSGEDRISKVEKSGYYITANFYGYTLMLLRFGWIDFADWVSQTSETGQAATLRRTTYTHKLVEIKGRYRLKSPVSILDGVGPKKVKVFESEGVSTIEDLASYSGNNPMILGFVLSARELGS